MGPKTSSGFYLSRVSAALLALLLAALLLALIVLGALYARTTTADHREEQSAIFTSTFTSSPVSFTLPPESTGRPGIWNNLRLPHNLVPLHYDLELWPRMQPDSDGNYLFSGQVNITISCVDGTDIVLLHSYNLNISLVELRLLGGEGTHKSDQTNSKPWQAGHKLHNADRANHYEADGDSRLQETDVIALGHGQSIGITNLWHSDPHQYLVLELERPLAAGNLYVLKLHYDAFISDDDSSGLFIVNYKDFDKYNIMVGSELEPASARTVFPCFDEPALKATFNTRIVHNSSYVALSNMPAIAVSEREDVDGTKWSVTTFNTTLKMSTYITAFIVCDFDYVKTTERGTEIRVWARKEAVQKGYANFALDIAGPILSFMEDLLNVTYPLQKTDLVAMPEIGVGAMENWGLITFQEQSLIYNPKQKFSVTKALSCLIVAHEIGHQWFGNLVTMKWWNDIWLNEGFASYMEYIGASFVDPHLKLNELFMLHNLINIFEKDTWTFSRPVSVKEEDINNVDDILPLFDDFTYNKAAALVRMASTFLTERLFIKGISSYLKRFSFSNADQDDLWKHLQMFIDDQDEVKLPATLKKIMDSWTWQKGIPLLTLNTSNGRLSQEHFKAANADNITSDNDQIWIIPVLWMKNGVQQPIIWLDTRTKIVPEMKTASDDDWILLNNNVTGYYRINYDTRNWNNLAKKLEEESEALPVVNRMQLIDDAFILANSGYIEYETALNLTRYLEKEMEIIVWYSVLKHLSNYKKSMITYHSFPLIKKYVLKRLNPLYQHYASILRRNFDETADDFFVNTCIAEIFKAACSLGLQDCLDLASELYKNWMSNASCNEIPQSIKEPIYCYGIAEGGEKEWQFAWNQYNKTSLEDHREQRLLNQGMSCAKEPWLLYRYLEIVLDIGSEPLTTALLGMFKNDIGRHISWEFLKENWKRLSDINMYESSQFFETLIQKLGWKVTSDLQFQEMQLFITTVMNGTDKDSELQKLESSRKDRLDWLNIVNSKIIDWLQKNTLDSEF